MTALKVLVINNLFPPQVVGGYERAMADYARHLHHRGHQVTVITADVPGLATSYAESEPEPMPVRRSLRLWGTWGDRGALPFPADWVSAIAIYNYQTLKAELDEIQPNVCLVGNLDFLSAPVIQQILDAGIPVAQFVMNARPGYAVELTPDNPNYQYITVSNWIKNELQSVGYPAANAITIYPGADTEFFYQSQLPSQEQLRIVYAGLVMHYKGTDILLESLYLLNQEGIEFTATIAGSSITPEFVTKLQEFTIQEQLSEKIKFVGLLSKSELKKLYQTHNVWVLPSRFNEPFSIGLLEAMTAGLTIIASDTGGSPEAVKHLETGLIFSSENPLELADNLSFLVQNPKKWAEISAQGQKYAMDNFSLAKTISEIEKLLRQLVEH